MEQKIETIKEITTDFLEKMGFVPDVSVEADGDGLFCRVRVENGQNFLIGQHGVNLAAIQHVVRIMARKRLGEPVHVTVDVNDYFSDKRSLLEAEAEKAAEEALETGTSVALRPMLPYERKLIHAYLSGKEGVVTESVGQGEERKIVVAPAPSGKEEA